MIWLWVVLFALGGLLFVALPFLLPSMRRARAADSGSGREATLHALYRSRREEIEREATEGQLDQKDLAATLAELDANFLRDMEARSESGAQGSDAAPRRVGMGLALGLVTAGLTVYLYSALGEPEADRLADASALLRLTESDTQALREWQEVLSERVASSPQDAKSQFLLGHVALKQRRYQAAADAFGAAHRAHGQSDPNIDLYWLQARFLAADGVLDDESRGLAEQLLAMSPNLPAVYEVLAIDAFNRSAFDEAVTVLNRALSVPMDVAQRASFAAGLEQARARMGTSEGPAIDVRIEGLEAVPADRTLFVIARPPGGGMPYAVVRRPGPDFPKQVRLDDAVSMNPAAPLSAAPAVEVVVRVSVSGNAMRGPGDWQWASAPLKFADQQQHAVVAQLAEPSSATAPSAATEPSSATAPSAATEPDAATAPTPGG